MNNRLLSSKFLLVATAVLTTGACSTAHDIGDNSATGGAPATSCPAVEPKNGDACSNVGLFCSYGAFSCPYHYTCNANGVFERSPVSGCYSFPGSGGTMGAGGSSGGYPSDGGNPATGGSGLCDELQSAAKSSFASFIAAHSGCSNDADCIYQGGFDMCVRAGCIALNASSVSAAATLATEVCAPSSANNCYNPYKGCPAAIATCVQGTCRPQYGGTGGTGSDLSTGGSTGTGGNVGSGGAATGGNTSNSGGSGATGGTMPQTSVTIGIASANRVDLAPITPPGATIAAPPNSGLRVELTTSAPVYQLTCMGGSVLTKANGSAILDQRPRCGTSPYYLADTYVANSLVPACMGCDQVLCQPLITTQTFVTYDIVKTSDRSVGDASAPLGEYAIQSTEGPYLLTISYYTDAKCTSTVRSPGPMLIDVGAGGSAAMGGSSGL